MSKHGYTLDQIAGNNLDYFKSVCDNEGKPFVVVLREGIDLETSSGPDHRARTFADKVVLVDSADELIACLKDKDPNACFDKRLSGKRPIITAMSPSDGRIYRGDTGTLEGYSHESYNRDFETARIISRLLNGIGKGRAITIEVDGHRHRVLMQANSKKTEQFGIALTQTLLTERNEAVRRAFRFLDDQEGIDT